MEGSLQKHNDFGKRRRRNCKLIAQLPSDVSCKQSMRHSPPKLARAARFCIYLYMVRPTLLVAETEPVSALSVRKLVLETAKFNVLTAHSQEEEIEILGVAPE